MKKIIILWSLFITVQSSYAQCLSKKLALESKAKSQRELTFSTKHIPGEPVKDTVEIIRLYRYDINGNLTERYEYFADGRRQSKIAFTFDESGKTIEADSMNGDGNILSKSIYSYDSKGKLMGIKSQDSVGNLLRQIAFTYNETGKIKDEKRTDEVGKISYRKVYKYDAAGTFIQSDYYDSDSKLYLSCKFNAVGNIYETKNYNADGTIFSRQTVTYDQNNNKAEVDDYDGKGMLVKKFTFISGPFVSLGFWIKETKYDETGKSISITDRDFEFYPQ